MIRFIAAFCVITFATGAHASDGKMWKLRTTELAKALIDAHVVALGGLECGNLGTPPGGQPQMGCSYFDPYRKNVLVFAHDSNGDGLIDMVEIMCPASGCDVEGFIEVSKGIVGFAEDDASEGMLFDRVLVNGKATISDALIMSMNMGMDGEGAIKTVTILPPRPTE